MQYTISLIIRFKRPLKYLISGGAAAVVNLGVLYVVTEYFHVWYIASSGIAFLFAFMVSFSLQKFWTFDSKSIDRVHKELGMYLAAALMNLALNTASMYVLVEDAHLHYLFAQIVTSGLIAFISFFVYQHLIFKVKHAE